MSTFVSEKQVYDLARQVDLQTPRHGLLGIDELPFQTGERVVVKGMATDLFHKAREGAVHIIDFDTSVIQALHERMREDFGDRYLGILVCEYITGQAVDGFITEALLSLSYSIHCGWMLQLGAGGAVTEQIANDLPPFVFPMSLASAQDALQGLKDHWLGKTWFSGLTPEKQLNFLEKCWQLPALLESQGIQQIEANPVVVHEGEILLLDGVGRGSDKAFAREQTPRRSDTLLNLQTFALVGVSTSHQNPGRFILDGLLRSSVAAENIKLILPDHDSYKGVVCVPDVASLDTSTDILIVALPADASAELITALCKQDAGPGFVYLIAGGLQSEARQQIHRQLEQRRKANLYAPQVLGANGLGFVDSKQQLSTFFLPSEKLPLAFNANSKLAILSQSGAFLVTLFSNHPQLVPLFACSIGNQVDVRLSDYLATLLEDDTTDAVVVYLEGFAELDALACARLIKASSKTVLIYQGGRSDSGQAAAQTHSDVLAGRFDWQQATLQRAGALIANSMREFTGAAQWLQAGARSAPTKLAVISNAGYETVLAADRFEGLYSATADEVAALHAALHRHKLQELVTATLPLDLTPMANEVAWLDCLRVVSQSDADAVLLSPVPNTPALASSAAAKEFAGKIAGLAQRKPIALCVDAGADYEQYRNTFRQAGLPVFHCMEEATLGLRLLHD